MGKKCARKLAIRIQNGLEGHMGVQEDLLRLLSVGIACKRSAGIGATLCPITANIYIYNISSVCREPIFVFPRSVLPPKGLCIAQLPEVHVRRAIDDTPRHRLLGMSISASASVTPTSARTLNIEVSR